MSVDPTRPRESNQDDVKMSDPSSSPPVQSLPPLESSDDEPSAGRPSLLVALILGLFKLVGVALLVYLTYFFTMTFAHRTPPPAPLTEDQRVLAKKAADLREQEKKLLSSYGWVNPATKSNVRIPIERAMELIAAEAAAPPAPAVVTAAAPGAGRATTTKAPAGSTAPSTSPAAVVAVAPPVPAGMPPEEMYRAVCMACHEADGKGKIFRLATPSIPDLTDPKWQNSRSDAELQHSILEGKESVIKGVKSTVMLAQKDNLTRAHTDVKDMVAYIRAFKGGEQIVSVTPGGTPAVTPPIPIALNPAPAVPAVSASATPPTSASPAQSIAAGSATSTSNPAPPSAVTVSTPVVAATPATAPAQAPTPAASAAVLPAALPTASTAAQAEKIRAAQATFNTLCIACHGADGRGTAVRAAMPALPNFTSHDWHTSKSNNQLASSIMEGKGLMPAWNTQLTAERARALALYVRSFGAPELMAETAPASGPSMAEFDNQMQALRQKFDDIEKQLQALAATSPRP